MSAPVKLAHREPCPSEERNLAARWQIQQMTASDRIVATCMYCKRIYRNASPANRCEHWHYPIP